MRVRQLDDVDQTDIALTALDSADVVSVEVRQLRQLFLGKDRGLSGARFASGLCGWSPICFTSTAT